ncbi:unnamed protein product [Paramecium octaurelia]|uniref:Transmembrane protein n=1 Tax=Paramecium octaurelia TaxID=43137 RepID=A0A8S1VE43_PAROT|nr:unnamed protein product [Paramecium octaurelia]
MPQFVMKIRFEQQIKFLLEFFKRFLIVLIIEIFFLIFETLEGFQFVNRKYEVFGFKNPLQNSISRLSIAFRIRFYCQTNFKKLKTNNILINAQKIPQVKKKNALQIERITIIKIIQINQQDPQQLELENQIKNRNLEKLEKLLAYFGTFGFFGNFRTFLDYLMFWKNMIWNLNSYQIGLFLPML